jgi:MoaA/NifB/PqqE/SkfB family radical SAM enzyme
VIANIQTLSRIRTEKEATFGMSLSFTLMASTLDEWPDFLRMAAAVGVHTVYTRHLEAYTAEMESESLWHAQDLYNAAYVSAGELAQELGISLVAPAPFLAVPMRQGHSFCHEPWRSPVILGNGDVAACCVPGTVMGNLHDQSLQDIWNGPRYQALRLAVNSSAPPWPCKACPIFRIPENRDSYLIYSAQRREQQYGLPKPPVIKLIQS